MHRGRVILPAAVATCALLVATSCTTDADDSAEEATEPDPTTFAAQHPPGLSEEPLRLLDDPEGESPEILDDAMGVRIQSLGTAFLISSNSDEWHLLQRAADGEALWEGDNRVQRFGRDHDGAPVLILEESDDPDNVTVRDAQGEELWSTTNPQERFVDGWAVEQPEDWSPEDPAGDYTVADLEGSEVWSYTTPDPDDIDAAEDEDNVEPGEQEPRLLGVPLGARDELVFRVAQTGVLEARDMDEDGTLRWSLDVDELPDVADSADSDDATVPRPIPQLVGTFEVPEDTGDEDTAEHLLLRWSYPEHPSVLSLVTLADGDPVWSLTEPGANPVAEQVPPTQVSGTVANPATGTVAIPQYSGDTSVIAVELATGEVRWEFEDEVERTIVPTFSLGSYLYGDSRGTEDHTQMVLDAETKELVAEEPDAYVETVTADGYALVVQDQERYVFQVDEDVETTEAVEEE